MNINLLLENDDFLSMFKNAVKDADSELADKEKEYSDINDDLDEDNARATLKHMIKRHKAKKGMSTYLEPDTLKMHILMKHGLIRELKDGRYGVTPKAFDFDKWHTKETQTELDQIATNRTKSEIKQDRSNRAMHARNRNVALKHARERGDIAQLRDVVQNLSPDEKNSFKKLRTAYFNKKMGGLAKEWITDSDRKTFKNYGVLDGENNITMKGKTLLSLVFDAFRDTKIHDEQANKKVSGGEGQLNRKTGKMTGHNANNEPRHLRGKRGLGRDPFSSEHPLDNKGYKNI